MNRIGSSTLWSFMAFVWIMSTTAAAELPCSPQIWTTGAHTLSHDGIERQFFLDVPPELKPGAAMVLVFHGYTDSAEGVRKSAGFTAISEQHGFVAVYPQGTRDAKGNAFFNVGYAFHKDQKVDDVAFARQLVDRLIADLKLNPDKVYATGMSNGGDMSYFLATQPDPFVAAIAPVAGTMMSSWGKEFVPESRIPVLAIHGTSDKTTLWAGDPENRDGWGAYLSVDAVMDRWVRGLALEKSEVTDLSISQRGPVTGVRLRRWWTSADATEVRLYELAGGEHDWPRYLADDLATADVIWDFFNSHRRSRDGR